MIKTDNNPIAEINSLTKSKINKYYFYYLGLQTSTEQLLICDDLSLIVKLSSNIINEVCSYFLIP